MTAEEILKSIKALPLQEAVRLGRMLAEIQLGSELSFLTVVTNGEYLIYHYDQATTKKRGSPIPRLKIRRPKPRPASRARFLVVNRLLQEWVGMSPKSKGGKWAFVAKKTRYRGGAENLKRFYMNYRKKYGVTI